MTSVLAAYGPRKLRYVRSLLRTFPSFAADMAMHVDAMLGLMRVAESGDRIVPDLAKVVMTLMARMKEVEMRAGLAEAQLADERAQVVRLQDTIRRLCNTPLLAGAATA